MTYQEAAQCALDCQDAVNLSGVVRSFSEALPAIWDEARNQGQGTEFVNTHPIVTLFLDKLMDLNRTNSADVLKVYAEVKAIAADQVVSA